VAEHEWGFGAGRRRDRGEVVVLPLRRERSGVATVTSPAAVVGDDCKTPPQFLWWDKGLACAECAHADYERRAIADPVVGDDGAVGGPHGFHVSTFLPWAVAHGLSAVPRGLAAGGDRSHT